MLCVVLSIVFVEVVLIMCWLNLPFYVSVFVGGCVDYFVWVDYKVSVQVSAIHNMTLWDCAVCSKIY